MDQKKVRVLIVDDSGLVREALRAVLNEDPGVEVIAVAQDGPEAIRKTRDLKPDVITMDLNMSGMSGFDAIEAIMEENPTPIIVVSSVDLHVVVKTLSVGAMDFVAVTQDIEGIAKDLIAKIKIASRVRPLKRMKIRPVVRLPVTRSEILRVVAIGVSTGGPQALQVLLSGIPAYLETGIVVVQHMSAGFMPGLVEWLKPVSHFEVREARAGDILKSGMILFAPDNVHMTIDGACRIWLKESQGKRAAHIPSIDVLMTSVAESFGDRAVGVLMTGMGRDGVEGMKAIKQGGGVTLAQDKASSVIFGMNQEAIESGCVDKVVPLADLADEIVMTCKE